MGLAFLLILLVFFALGYGTRSYLGGLVPMAIFAAVVYVVAILEPIEHGPRTPELYDDVLDDVALVCSGLLVLSYLAGVVLARRRRAASLPLS